MTNTPTPSSEAVKPMQGLADFLRLLRALPEASNQIETLTRWADEVDSARELLTRDAAPANKKVDQLRYQIRSVKYQQGEVVLLAENGEYIPPTVEAGQLVYLSAAPLVAPRVPMTAEQINDAWWSRGTEPGGTNLAGGCNLENFTRVIRWAERWHGIKGSEE